MNAKGLILEEAERRGITLIGFSAVEKTPFGDVVKERIARGLIPEHLVENTDAFRTPDVFSDPKRSLASARTLVCLGAPHFEEREKPSDMSMRGAIARDFWRDNYGHLRSKRDSLVTFLRSKGYEAAAAKVHPREAAKLTGLAWIGRNCLAISPTYGSWVAYYALVTDAEIEQTPRIEKSCPKGCRKCIDACPTHALVEPYVLDASRCLCFVMEDTVAMPVWARKAVGNRINGCDACQEACPVNKTVNPAPKPLTARAPAQDLAPFPLLERCFEVTDDEMRDNLAYMDWFEPTPKYLKRNALIALGNSGQRDLIRAAERFADDPDPMLREHARWAVEELARAGKP
jgi:epoxyqueuosine reductase